MANKIYTIGREFGSGGQYVGEKLAERLGIKLYDKELLQQASKDSGFLPYMSKSYPNDLLNDTRGNFILESFVLSLMT
jgi:cytidylate kinase